MARARMERDVLISPRGYGKPSAEELKIMLGTILLVILVLMVIGSIPTWPYSTGWGYYPAGGLGTILIIVLVLVLLRRI
jgi:uncharacterized protein DUF3309